LGAKCNPGLFAFYRRAAQGCLLFIEEPLRAVDRRAAQGCLLKSRSGLFCLLKSRSGLFFQSRSGLFI
jgi:hypothetical protein